MTIVWMAHDRANYIGGPIVNTTRLLPELARRGHNVHALIAWKDEHPNADFLVSAGVTCHLINSPKYSEDFVRWILEKVKEIQPDVFVPNILNQGCLSSRWIKEAGIPVINTLRSPDQVNLGRAEYFANCETHFRYTGLVCVSKFLADLFQKSLDMQLNIPVKIIPSGVVIPQIKSIKANKNFTVAYSGRLTKEIKRFDILFNIFLEMSRNESNMEFQIFGEGDKREREYYWRKVQDNGQAQKFKFHGALSGNEYQEKLYQCDVIVLYSLFEGIPGALMDGMACGLVPISTYFGGIEELIDDGDNGFVISDNPKNLIEKLLLLKSNPGIRERMAMRARKTIIDRFSIKIAADRWEEFFMEQCSIFPTKKGVKIPRKIKLPKKSKLLKDDKRKPDLFYEIKKALHKRIIQLQS